MQKVNSNILWLPSWYPSKLNQYNGDFIQRQAIALSQLNSLTVVYIVRDKFQTVTNSVKIENNESSNLKETIIYYSIPAFVPKFLEGIYSFWMFRKLYRHYFKKLFIGGLPSTVHVHVAYKAGLIALWIKRNYGIPYYVSEHWSGYSKSRMGNYFTSSLVNQNLIKKILRAAKLVIPVSIDLGNQIKYIVPTVKIKVIPNVVDENLFYYKPNQSSSFKFIHYTSKDTEAKNTIGLLETLSDLKCIRKDWSCVIYGPAEPVLIEFVEKNNLQQHIKFTGEIQYAAVAEIVREASAFISFSNYENQPCSILEALCCGVPVIATKVGGIPEIVELRNGILIDAKNEIQLVEALKSMLEDYNRFDRQQIATEAINKYSYPIIAKKLLALYSEYHPISSS
ncbi:MAG: glycosyltransferase family 4 protein [Chitinophagaceae bacterium]|nr:MAG: glycosyltransferase family 4 protein [Chitinophagaceae bacterium]